jgi:hypothetical protein
MGRPVPDPLRPQTQGESAIFISVSNVRGKDLVSAHLSRGVDSRRLVRFGGEEYFDAWLTGVRIRVLERTPTHVRLLIDRENIQPIAAY